MIRANRIRGALAASVLFSSVTLAQDARVEDLFPGIALTRQAAFRDVDLYASTYARINSRGRAFVALVYYQPYPDSPGNRYTNYALLERTGERHEVLLDTVVSDSGSSDHEEPFLNEVDGTDLIAFSSCYRGCRYSFFLLDSAPVRVPVEEYKGLGENEYFEGRGDVYRFEESGLVVSRNISRAGDPSCCPSGGTMHISYILKGNSFLISDATRTE